jgi:hypothetical protein
MYLVGLQSQPAEEQQDIMLKYLTYLLFILGFSPGHAICQGRLDSSDTLLLQNAVRFFYQTIGDNSLLYNGKEYLPYPFTMEGQPYLDSDQMQTGSVTYEGILYPDIPVLYDLFRDLLVTKHYNPVFRISLLTEKVDSFTIASHHFIRLAPDSVLRKQIAPGFYELLYNGKTSVLAKRKKVVEQTTTVEKIKRSFLVKDSYFIKVNGNYYLVKSRAGLLDAFSGMRKEISKYLKRKTLRYRDEKEAALVAAAKHYDELTSSNEK